MIIQIKDFPYFYTDGKELYSNKGMFGSYRKLSGWAKVYTGRWRYIIKKEYRHKSKYPVYFYKDDLIKIYNNNLES